MIGMRTAMVLYGLLAAVAVATTKGKLLALALIIIAALAVKTLVQGLRERM